MSDEKKYLGNIDHIAELNDTDTFVVVTGSGVRQITKKQAEEVLTSKLKSDLSKKVSLPVKADGTVDNGTVGQFAVSDGAGGVTWVTIEDGNGVSY